MRVGCSLLWGEVFEASDLDYELTRDLQVVCPCCKESVVKVRRPLAVGRETHYLAHRRADAERDAVCELRVSSMGAADFARLRQEGREQSLAAFLAVFCDRLNGFAMEAHNRVSAAEIDAALSQPNLRRILAVLANGVRELVESGHARGPAERESYLRTFPERRKARGLPSVSRQVLEEGYRFTDDMLAHLVLPQASANLERLLALTLMAMVQRGREKAQAPDSAVLGAHLADLARRGTFFDKMDTYAGAFFEPIVHGFGKLKTDSAHQKLFKVVRPLFPEYQALNDRDFFKTVLYPAFVQGVFLDAANILFIMSAPDVFDGAFLEKAEKLDHAIAPVLAAATARRETAALEDHLAGTPRTFR